MRRILTVQIVMMLLIAGCLISWQISTPSQTKSPTPFTPTNTTQTITPPALTQTPNVTATQPPTETMTQPSNTPEPEGCLKPPDDYARVEVNGETLNQRTLSMLAHAQELYGGELEITGHAITQGSYTDNLSASFGTHAGGGAVDLSVLRRDTYTVLWDDVEPLIRALRVAGFAAWLREYGELYADSPIHIHAIAIGDAELSSAAIGQLTGESGYFRGFSGLTDPNGIPTPDRYGGPILCGWMLELGYQDLR